ncbi:MAG: hypothetical protein L0Z54_06720, partial [Thermoplasmata archaeon]|nr:hypothetical protein [Thermoplasmata archaeon]
MVRWFTAVVVVLAIASPVPMFLEPPPGGVDVDLDRLGWTAPLLDKRPHSDVIYVSDISDLEAGRKLTYLSLQGLANRVLAEVYLINSDKDVFWLEELQETQGVAVVRLSPEALARRYADLPRGIVVVDPDREETVNVATTVAGVEGMVIAYPSQVETVRSLMGDLAVIDLRQSPWRDLAGMDLYRRAFDRYFSRCHQRFVGFMPPANLYARDLMVQQGAFVLYQVPGPFSNPLEWSALKGILADTPHTHALLGAVEPYIGAEEDFAIREFSLHGKYFVPCALVPNLSLLSCFEGTERVDLGVAEPTVTLERKHYVCVGMEDGDNLAFLHDRMVDHWLQPERGTFPVAWTVPPYVRELAPLYMDHYLRDASGMDTFVLAPSGAGLAFPDFLPDGALDRFMELTTAHALDMNVTFAWALNSYRTYEVRWSDGLLERYVDMRIRGLLLDYDDMPWHHQYRIVGDAEHSAPVVRSTQLWRDTDNLRAKLDVAREAFDERPFFTFLAFNPWAADLGELLDILEDLECEVVDMATFFALIELAAFDEAERTVRALRGIPTSALVPSLADGAEDMLDADGGDADAYRAWRARERAEAGIGVALSILLLLVAAAVVLPMASVRLRSGRGPPGPGGATRVAAMALVLTGFLALYYRIQFSETWNYFPLTAAIFVIPVAAALSLKRPRGGLPVAGVVLVLAGLASCYVTWWAFPFYATGAFLVVAHVARGHMDEFVVALSLALSLSLLVPRDLGFALAVALPLPALLHLAPALRAGDRFEGGASPLGGPLAALVVIGALVHDSR